MQEAAALFTIWLSLLGCFGLEKTHTRPHKPVALLTAKQPLCTDYFCQCVGKVGEQVGWEWLWHLSHLQWVSEPAGSGTINYSVLLSILSLATCNSCILYLLSGFHFFSQHWKGLWELLQFFFLLRAGPALSKALLTHVTSLCHIQFPFSGSVLPSFWPA